MAITKETDILNLNEVNASLEYLDCGIKSLESAIVVFVDAAKYCDANSFSIKGNNTFPTQIEEIITQAKNIKDSVSRTRTSIYNSAVNINKADQAEYNAYLEEQKKAAEENGGN